MNDEFGKSIGLRELPAEVDRLREIERCARALIVEVDRKPGDAMDTLEAEDALRRACFPKTTA